MKETTDKKPFHEEVAERIISQLEKGTAPWLKPWTPGDAGFMPMNPTTGARYKGINALYLSMMGHGDPRWATYKQAAAEGWQVRKGEKATSIQYWKFDEEKPLRNEAGKPVKDADGKTMMTRTKLDKPRVFYARVFNAEQMDNVPAREINAVDKPIWNGSERAEKILASSEAKIFHDQDDRAFYSQGTDQIHLPPKSFFETADRYYATALHELGHWTGHSDRLNRDLAHPFGSAGYAKEELRAEISSMLVGDQLGIGHDPSQHVAYVGSWIKAIKEDHFEIFRAAADAEKIQKHIMAFEQKIVVEKATDPLDVLDKVHQERSNAVKMGSMTSTLADRLTKQEIQAASTIKASPALLAKAEEKGLQNRLQNIERKAQQQTAPVKSAAMGI